MSKKVKQLTISRTKSVDVDKLSALLDKQITAKKVKYGVILTSYTDGGFSERDAIIIAETMNMIYNGKCIR